MLLYYLLMAKGVGGMWMERVEDYVKMKLGGVYGDF